MHTPHGRGSKSRKGQQDGLSATGVMTKDRPAIHRAPVGAQIVYAAKPQPAPGPDRTWWALGLSLSLIAVVAKFALLPFPVTNASEFARWLLRLSFLTAPDVCFATALTAVCYGVSLGLR